MKLTKQQIQNTTVIMLAVFSTGGMRSHRNNEKPQNSGYAIQQISLKQHVFGKRDNFCCCWELIFTSQNNSSQCL